MDFFVKIAVPLTEVERWKLPGTKHFLVIFRITGVWSDYTAQKNIRVSMLFAVTCTGLKLLCCKKVFSEVQIFVQSNACHMWDHYQRQVAFYHFIFGGGWKRSMDIHQELYY